MTAASPQQKNNCDVCMMTNVCGHLLEREPHQCKLNPVAKQSLQLKRKELLYSYRDTFKCIYAVNAGAVKTFQIDMNGQERILNFYLPGEVIGLEAIQTGYYPYSAIAMTPATLCEIPFNDLLDYISDYPALQRHIITTLGYRINQGQYITAPGAEQRLAAFILDINNRVNDKDNQNTLELAMSRYDIGNYLGLAPETISRIFTRFQQAALIQVQQKKITLLNASKLQWIAQDGIQSNELKNPKSIL